MNKLKGFSYKKLLNFKMVAVVLYIVATVVVWAAINNYEYTQEMIDECIVREKKENPQDWMMPGFGCHFHPLSHYLFKLIFPGILFTDFFDQNLTFRYFFNKLPNELEYFIISFQSAFQSLISLSVYIFMGHLVDLFIRFIRNRGVNSKS